MVVSHKLGPVLAGFALSAAVIGCSASHGASGKPDDSTDAPAKSMDRAIVPPLAPLPGATAGASAPAQDPPARPAGDDADGANQPALPGDRDEPAANEPTPAQPPPSSTTPDPLPRPRGESCLLPGDGHYGEPGPYEVGTMTVAVDDGRHEYTIFYPIPFEENCGHPIVAWGNATAVSGTEKYEFLNANAASWGLVVAAAHTPNAYGPEPYTAGIDWLLAQNADPASIFHGKLSKRAGVAGHEQAGVGASLSAVHPNVEAVVAAMANANPNLGPGIAYACLTGNEDVLSNGYCTKAFETAAGPAFLASWHGADFFAPTREQYEKNNPASFAVQRLYAAWMRCFLADDATACKMFRGEPCGMCGEEGWARLESRNL